MTAGPGETRIAAGALLRGEAVAGPHLQVVAGPGTGRRLPLGERQILGRGRAADLKLVDPAASRRHLRLERIDGRWVVEDLGSKNGVRVNGERCSAGALLPGDELGLGSTRLLLSAGLVEAAESAPEPTGASVPSDPEDPRVAARPVAAALLAAATLAAAAALLLALP